MTCAVDFMATSLNMSRMWDLCREIVIKPWTFNGGLEPQTCTPDSEQKALNLQVRTWDQYCDYLQRKDERIKRDILPFSGRNVVLYLAEYTD